MGKRNQLVLSRKIGERIYIGSDIVIELVAIRKGQKGRGWESEAVVGIVAPKEKKVLRRELVSRDAGMKPAQPKAPEQDAPGAQGETK